jgi:hypothetical protein
MSDKLSIANEMRMFDRKVRTFYDDLTDEERKKFSNYLMIRWGSCVDGSRDLQEFYVISTNERLNKHFFSINKHPKLQWLCATSVSPGLGSQHHNWIPNKKKEDGSNTVKKALMELMPTTKMSDIETLCKLITKKELRELLREHGDTPDI